VLALTLINSSLGFRIPWVPNFKAKDFQTLKVKAGQNNSFEVYAIGNQNDDKPKMFFVAIKRFQHARIILNLNEAQSRLKFASILQGSALVMLNTVNDELANNVPFDERVKLFVGEFFDHNDHQRLKDQLMHAKKPTTIMGVHDFYNRIKTFNRYITIMPGAMEALDDNALKSVFWNGMSQPWRDTYTKTGSNWVAAPLADLLKFMVAQQQVADQNLH
jgi:hypothetical protein